MSLLERISGPHQLASLSPAELQQLCEEIRERILSTVSRTGGHLGSNLGIVELTVAIHRVFESPRDAIIFDGGHQAYPHKLLTGRVESFDQLRQEGGLSGYPRQLESIHDWVENSHSSIAISWADGLATGFKEVSSPDPSDRCVVAVVGDGALTGGQSFEALNNIGHRGVNVTIVLNDNGRSYRSGQSFLSEIVKQIRLNPGRFRRRSKLRRALSEIPLLGRVALRGIEASKAAVREALEPMAFFEMLGVRYLGPFDGHDLGEAERVLAQAKQIPGPVVVHFNTQKGRGYAPPEQVFDSFFEGGTPQPDSYTKAFTESLIKLAEEHKEIIAITAAMPDSTGLLPYRERYPDRVIDVGIAEPHAVTAAAGMAQAGLRPVVALYSAFMTRAIDQIHFDVALHGLPVIFCLDRAGVTGEDGASHHGTLDISLLLQVPGMTIFAPSSYQELQQMMMDAYEITSGPVCIRWPKSPAPSVSFDEVGFGLRARQLLQGTDVCLVGVGKMLRAATEAAKELSAGGLSVSVWDPRVVKPIDETLLAEIMDHRLVVTVEDGAVVGGFGSAVMEAVAARSVEEPPRLVPLGLPAEFIPHGPADRILSQLGLDGPGVASTVRQLLAADSLERRAQEATIAVDPRPSIPHSAEADPSPVSEVTARGAESVFSAEVGPSPPGNVTTAGIEVPPADTSGTPGRSETSLESNGARYLWFRPGIGAATNVERTIALASVVGLVLLGLVAGLWLFAGLTMLAMGSGALAASYWRKRRRGVDTDGLDSIADGVSRRVAEELTTAGLARSSEPKRQRSSSPPKPGQSDEIASSGGLE